MIALAFLAGYSPIQAIFVGGLIGTVLAVTLIFAVCGGQTASADLASSAKPATRYAAQAADLSPHADARTADAAVQTPAAAPLRAASATVSPTVGTADPVAAAPATAAVPDVAPAPVAATAAPVKEPVEQSKVVAAPAQSPAADADGRPAILMAAPRPEGRDDLKLISGVGLKLEQTLNDLGVYHFDQVAKFKKKDIAWVDERLRFKGRIERDDWMAQAKILAKGGETEFSKGKKKS
jgi:predicted flap endonuclease-1-like 5' DNA nuclease